MPPRVPRRIDVLWCPNNRHPAPDDGWRFPRAVEKQLRALTEGKSVLQLFGGRSTWGVKLDIDAVTEPHVLGDAWMAPFGRDTFDVVILDPPYFHLSAEQKGHLLRQAAFIARERVIWFHTIWIYSAPELPMERAWLVRVGDDCAIRCIQVFAVCGLKDTPAPYFRRGPAVKYNRWIAGQTGLPYGDVVATARSTGNSPTPDTTGGD
jgi:hypothetical protein